MSDDLPEGLAPLAAVAGRLYRGEVVALLVVVTYLLFVGVSAATAPPVDVGQTETGSDTLVGTQGPFRETKGYTTSLGPNGTTQWQSPEAWAHFDVDRLPNGHILRASWCATSHGAANSRPHARGLAFAFTTPRSPSQSSGSGPSPCAPT